MSKTDESAKVLNPDGDLRFEYHAMKFVAHGERYTLMLTKDKGQEG